VSIRSKLETDRATRVPFGKTADIPETDVQRAIEAVYAAVEALTAAVAAHLADAVDAHDASAISVVPAGSLAATDAQAALVEILGDIEAHIADATAAHAAAAISYDGGTGISATTVEGAIDELATEKLDVSAYTAADVLAKLLTVDGAGSGLDADLLDGQSSAFYATASSVSDHLADASDAHDASAISFSPAGNIAATDVQAAIAELDTEKQPLDELLTEIAALSTDPNADSGVFFDDSAGNVAYWTPTGALSFSGINLLVASASDSNVGVVEGATDAEVRAATADKFMDAALLESASALVALSDAATIAVDWDSGINFSVQITANRVLGNPTNGQPGTWRTVYVFGNDGTDRTLTFGNQYAGELSTLTDIDSGRAYLLMIMCLTSSHFVVSAKRALG